MSPYFPADLLQDIRNVEFQGARIPNPQFYADAKALGFVNLPDLAHMNSMTFLDVLVFNEQLTERALFHALVHAVQFQVLGVERYTELFVRNFINTRFHFLVPLEAHAFLLESKFVPPIVGKVLGRRAGSPVGKAEPLLAPSLQASPSSCSGSGKG